MKTYRMEELEWVDGRMVHLHVPGRQETICGASMVAGAYSGVEYIPGGGRPVLTAEKAAEKHQCKGCLKRVRP